MNAMLPPLLGYEPPPTDALLDHARTLYERRHEAAPVVRVDVGSDAWRPTVNACHDNCEAWCERHPDHQLVRGWLYFSLPGMAYCRFVSHSVVRRPDGTLVDITPTGHLLQADPYPFLDAGVDEDAYAALATELYETTGNGNLCFQHGEA
ncbi:hypothetical protein ACT2FY_00930 [Paraburkholderia fungorum]|jgi:hypothetical protein